MKTGLSALAMLAAAGVARAEDIGLPVGVLIFDAEPAQAEPFQADPLETTAIETVAGADPLVLPVAQPLPLAQPLPVVETTLPTAPLQQTQASIRSGDALAILPAGEVPAGEIVPQVDLAPGETVIQVLAVPSIVRVPAAQPVTQPVALMAPVQPVMHEPKVDPVTGRLRDTPGWTGRTDAAAGIGCFPEGACSALAN